ncbi:hypothetical protein [Roseisolibacter sp. H3M3-2]|uniref:hypothetical protein n=1 Tax=Roseisolibacter sp. H3M3-2 TaxID=3031323 RepID=UPI0023DA4C65|nr:hypothetical protein [Roseisolibacter sp. H3M3-2]MDF1502775.1 hypothetical protein [Roseisolibacter sp. H3M3-2]
MSAERSEWYRRADALAREGRIEDAERLIRDAVPHVAFAYVTAELHADRMRRLRGEGDHAGAARALADARRWIDNYASMATSGGEGYALAADRDRFLATLPDVYDADGG